MIVVVGIGADGMAGLAPTSRAELARATVVYGSARQLELLDDTVSARRRPWPSPMLPALRTLLENAEGDVHVVASGDPLMHGVGGTLIRLYGPDRVAVLPHVSSVTLACSRVGWTVQDTEIISLVTAEPHTAVRRGGRAVVMSRDATTPAALARLLTETGRGDSEITVLEQLGGPAERRRSATAREWAARPPGDVDALNVVAVRYLPDERRLSVLPDDSFAHDGQITKQSMRAVTLAALAPRPGELLWDVGAGSGSVAIEWCRSGSGCHAVAFERDEQRRKRIADNATAFGVSVDVRSDAPRAFDAAAAPAAIFVGGGLTEPGLFDACYERLARGRQAGGERGDCRVGGRSHRVVFARRWRVAALPALQRRTAGQIHRLAPGDARHAVGGHQGMTVYFIGAGPGAADLITVRGQRLLGSCPVCLYAGSIMPDDLLALCPPDARIVDTGPLTLDAIIGEIADATAAGSGCGTAAFGRSVALQRARRTVQASRCARHRIRDRARRTGFRGGRGGARAGNSPCQGSRRPSR